MSQLVLLFCLSLLRFSSSLDWNSQQGNSLRGNSNLKPYTKPPLVFAWKTIQSDHLPSDILQQIQLSFCIDPMFVFRSGTSIKFGTVNGEKLQIEHVRMKLAKRSTEPNFSLWACDGNKDFVCSEDDKCTWQPSDSKRWHTFHCTVGFTQVLLLEFEVLEEPDVIQVCDIQFYGASSNL